MKWTDKFRFDILFYGQDDIETDGILLRATYENNKLVIGNRCIPSVVDGDILYWKDGDKIGSLSFIHDSRIMRGVIIDGGQSYRVKASADTIIPLEFQGGDLPKRKFRLVMGSRSENGNVISYLVLRGEDGEQNYGYGTSYEKKDKDTYHTHVRVSVLPMTDESLGFGFIDVAFDASYCNVSGSAWLNEEDASKSSPVCTVSGQIVFSSDNIDKGDVQLSDICTCEQKEILDECKNTLCVEELFTMPMPVVEDVNNSFPDAIYKLMCYAISDEQLNYIKVERPDYTDEEKNDADTLLKDSDIKGFITKDYYYANLSQMLAQNASSPYASLITDIPNYKEKLEGYFSSSNSTSMNQNKGYQKLTQYLYPKLYFRSSPFLKSYLTDKEAWAKVLHQYALYNENTYSLVDAYAHNPQSNMHNMVVLLDYFDGKKNIKLKNKIEFSCMDDAPQDYYISYGSDIYYHLYNKQIALDSFRFRLSDSIMDQEERKKFYEESARTIVRDIYAKSSLSESEQKVKDFVEDAVGNKTISDWTEAYSYIALFLCEWEAVIAGTEKCTLRCLSDYFTAHPNIHSGLRIASLVLCQGLMIANQTIAYMDWNNLSDAQKAQAVIGTVYTAVDIFSVAGDIYQKLSQKDKIAAEAASEVSDQIQNGVKATEGMQSAEVESLFSKSKKFLEALKASAKEMSTMSKVSGGILSALAFAVSVCDVVNDKGEYGSGSAVYMLDIATSVVNGLAMVATVGFWLFGETLIGVSVFAAALPGIGFVCTIIGILFSFITFLVKKFSKTVEQKYIEQNCVPFVKALELPDKKEVIELMYDELSGTYRIQCV